MSSNVVVIDSNARRHTIKVTPGKILRDVLDEACQKLRTDPSRFGLKHNNKTLDLSNPFRLSGLSSGAKLELVVVSRSPSVVSVALQLPDAIAEGIPAGRLVDKFPSDTTLWLILRKFESGAQNRNYTARFIQRVENGQNGTGRLYHNAPTLHIMSRELSSFTDLQKTLAQLGFNSGNVLLRLSFKATDTPFEEAMEQMEMYFKSIQSDSETGAPTAEGVTANTIPIAAEPATRDKVVEPQVPVSPNVQGSATDLIKSNDNVEKDKDKDESFPQVSSSPLTVGPDQRPTTIYLPPSASTPRAAQQEFNERDYVPSIIHAKLHQARLESSGRNKTLLSDKELVEKEKAKAQKLADVKQIEIKIKFPDECTVSAPFSSADTCDSLYNYTQTLLYRENQPFILSFPDAQGRRKPVPRGSSEKLISGLGMSGKTLVHFSWEAGATPQPRSDSVLKPEMRAQAKEIEIKDPPAVEAEDVPVAETSSSQRREPGKSGSKGVPKWLKGLSKK